jgi:amyloid beta precursor protein binding protein 1
MQTPRRLTANALTSSPKALAIHLALSAASSLASKCPIAPGEIPAFTVEAISREARSVLPPGVALPTEFEDMAGEMYVCVFQIGDIHCL